MIHEITMKIQQRKKDIENWDTIKRFLSIYLYERAIPHFKKKKNNKYITAMQSFTLDELKNSKASQNCWDEFFALTQTVRGDGQWTRRSQPKPPMLLAYTTPSMFEQEWTSFIQYALHLKLFNEATIHDFNNDSYIYVILF